MVGPCVFLQGLSLQALLIVRKKARLLEILYDGESNEGWNVNEIQVAQ